VRIALLFGVLAGCYSPEAKPGAQCSPGRLCPDNLQCAADNTCEPHGYQPIDAPTDVAIDATMCTTTPPPNDRPSGAIDITAGGDFTADLSCASDDASPDGSLLCGGNGGRDVFYTVTTSKTEVYYFDTFGSDFDTVIRVYPGACRTGSVANMVCHNDACNTTQTQWTGQLTTGTNCVVVDQLDGSGTTGQLHLHVEGAAWSGSEIHIGPHTLSASTAAFGSDTTSTCGGAGPDRGYYATACPGETLHLDASTCSTSTTYNTVIYVLGVDQAELACNDNDATCSVNLSASTLSGVALTGAHLFWLIVDGPTAADSGAYSLTTTLQ
jgi:hypothetical protein